MKKACKSVKSEEPPTLELTGAAQLPQNTNCLACSEDGMYLCLGHSRGLSVWCASSLTPAAEWLQNELEVNFIQTTRMTELTYLLGTVDDMGVARLFLHHSDSIHLLSVINAMEDINKRRICLTLDVFEGGGYGASSFSCNGADWLEIYQFPSAAWLRELAGTQKQETNVSKTWSSVAVMMKIAPPEIPAGRTLDRSVGDYLTHCLRLSVATNSSVPMDKSSVSTDQGQTQELYKCPRRYTHHFLLPCDQFLGDTKANLQPDVDPIVDVLWPHAKEIQCSAVSRSTRYIALGLDDALVCVWDRLTGAPLSVVLMPRESSQLSKIQFFDHWPVSAQDPQMFHAEMLHLLVLYTDGVNYTVTTGRERQPCTTELAVRPKDSRDLQTVTTSVPFLQGVSFVVQRNGRMFLQDVANRVNLCFLTLPTSHQITSPCSPVYVLSTKQQSLFIRGDLDTSCCSFSQESSQSQLFAFHLAESDIIKEHIVSQPESPQTRITLSNVTPEEICNLYLQQRLLSVDERNKAIAQTWERLQEIAVTLQRGQQLRNSNK